MVSKVFFFFFGILIFKEMFYDLTLFYVCRCEGVRNPGTGFTDGRKLSRGRCELSPGLSGRTDSTLTHQAISRLLSKDFYN